MPVDPPYNAYCDELTSLSQGLALWNPNPPKDIDNNVSIGDVGYLKEGAFIRMFNVILPWGPYESLDYGPFTKTLKRHFDRVEHYSRSVTAETNDGNIQAITLDE